MNRFFRNASLALATGTLACSLYAQGTMPAGSAPNPAPSNAGEGYPGNAPTTQPRKQRAQHDRSKHSTVGQNAPNASRPDAARNTRDAASQATRRPTDARPAAAAPAAAPGAPAVQTQSDRVDATGAAPSTGEATRTPAAAPSPNR